MLTRMRIVNIQKHKDLDLVLDKINVIVGATDSGKTSVLRALTWALTNDESGERLINNDGAKSCSVKIITEAGTVTRYWSKGKNAYSLNDKEFTTFRTSVPEPIAELFNIDDINIQRRRDLPFMVYFKDSECANQFSDMMDLSEIDSIVTASNRSVKQHADIVEQLKTEKTDIESELSQLVDLDSACEAYNELRKLSRDIKALKTELETLRMLQKRHSEATCDFSRVFDPAEADTAVEALKTQAKRYYETLGKLNDCKKLLHDYLDATMLLQSAADVTDADKAVRRLECRREDISELVNRMHELDRLRTTVRSAEIAYNGAEMMYNKAKADFDEAFPNICPLCGKVACND